MRPRRLYIEPDTKKPYYIINGKKKYVKVPKGVSMKQLQKVNIRNIINIPMARRIKRRRKKVVGKFQQKINNSMKELTVGGLPLYLFQEKKEVPELALAGREKKKETTILVPNSTTLPLPPPPPRFNLPLPPAQPPLPPPSTEAPSTAPPSAQPPKQPKNPVGRPPGSTKPEGNTMSVNKIKSLIKKHFKEEDYPTITREKLEVYYPKSGTSKYLSKDNVDKAIEELSAEFLEGLEGKGSLGDGLYNDEIETITKKRLKRFVPVIASDETEELMRYVSKGDKEFAFVINTNSSDSDGSGNDGHRPGHWTCVYFDNRDDYPSAEFYDPLAEGKPPQAVVNIMRKISRKMNPEKMFKYKQNLIRRQSRSTSNCGQHCIKFIEDRMNGTPFCEASGYDDFIATHQGADNSEDGEKDLKKYIPIYKSYV